MDAMNTLQISVLIRTLFVLAMLALMVIAGALTARRSNGSNDSHFSASEAAPRAA